MEDTHSETTYAEKIPSSPPATAGIYAEADGELKTEDAGFGSPAPAASPMDHAAKQLNFEAGAKAVPSSPETPQLPGRTPPATSSMLNNAADMVTPLPASHGAEATSSMSSMVDYNSFIRDTLLWTNQVRSGLYLVGGLLLVYAVNSVMSSSITLVTGTCWLLLAQLALNFVRLFISPSLQERCNYTDSTWTHGLISSVTSTVKAGAAIHDAHMQSADAAKTLAIGAGLWILSLAGRSVSAIGLVTAVWIGAFTLPKAYMAFKKQIDPKMSHVMSESQRIFSSLDPKAKGAILVVPILLGGYLLSSVDLAIAVFLLLACGRMYLKPSQVQAINAKVAPYTTTASKIGTKFGSMVNTAAAKYELTPTPIKSKRI